MTRLFRLSPRVLPGPPPHPVLQHQDLSLSDVSSVGVVGAEIVLSQVDLITRSADVSLDSLASLMCLRERNITYHCGWISAERGTEMSWTSIPRTVEKMVCGGAISSVT